MENVNSKDDDALFEKVWKDFKQILSEAIREDDVDKAHATWVLAIELFLWRLAGNLGDLPSDQPRRGTVMPRIMSKVTLQLGEFAPKLFGIDGIRLGRLVGRAKDLCARLGGWTNRIDRKLASTSSKKKRFHHRLFQ